MTIHMSGLSGALCVFGDSIHEGIAQKIACFMHALEVQRPRGFLECIPSFCALLVRYDPLQTDFEAICKALRNLEHTLPEENLETGKIVEIPVCYGGDHGPDLAFVARHAGLSEREVIALHTASLYRIYMLGFLPGFPYLGGLDPRLHTPRLSSPRVRIPGGSVGIGGSQTGIYPMDSPGGWQLIGQTPLKLFALHQPFPYTTGDQIQFVPITEDEFVHIQEAQP